MFQGLLPLCIRTLHPSGEAFGAAWLRVWALSDRASGSSFDHLLGEDKLGKVCELHTELVKANFDSLDFGVYCAC